MDAIRVKDLLELIEKAQVMPPDADELPPRNLAIIAKAEADIDAEVATP